jgi:hypothetical protein
VQRYQANLAYAEPPLLYRNRGDGTFTEVGAQAFPGLPPLVGRGAACADWDNDGDLDLAISVNGGAARLLRNDGGNRNGWLSLSLEGTRSNRDAVGAVVRLSAGGRVQTSMVRSGSSYASQSDRRLVFGLGAARAADWIEVRWPAGGRERLQNVAANQRLTLREGSAGQ